MSDTTIFSLRFGSNQKLQPSHEDLANFLESKKEGSTNELHSADIARYWQLLTKVARFKSGEGLQNFHDKILCTVLVHSHFAKPALKSAVEQYKFHVHSLSTLDFKKPISFIKSAEEEIARLSAKKKDEALRIERMRGMIEERKQTLDKQKKRWIELADELSHIISYVDENLSKIVKLCEKSIAVLAREQIERKKETGLIEDIKWQYKERLRDALRQGTITQEQMNNAKEEVAELSKRTADLMLSDIFTVTQMYEHLYEHAGAALRELKGIAGEVAKRNNSVFDEDRNLYLRAERILIALISDFRFQIKADGRGPESDPEPDAFLAEKRREIMRHLVDLVQKTA